MIHMKSKFYLFLLVPALILASCQKWVPDSNSNRIVGNWQIVSVERQGSFGSEPVYTGYENGVFYFNNNGNAQYSDNIGQMNGSWQLMQRQDGYYDYYGNWRNGPSTSLELRVYDYYNDYAIEWEFYAIEFTSSGNRLVGYMNRYGYDYRYEF